MSEEKHRQVHHRGTVYHQTSVRFPVEHIEILAELGRMNHRSRNGQLCHVVKEWLAREFPNMTLDQILAELEMENTTGTVAMNTCFPNRSCLLISS